LQALYLLNSEFVTGQAKALAGRLHTKNESRKAQIQRAYQLCYSRQPAKSELDASMAFIKSTDLPTLCQSLLATAEFRNLD